MVHSNIQEFSLIQMIFPLFYYNQIFMKTSNYNTKNRRLIDDESNKPIVFDNSNIVLRIYRQC